LALVLDASARDAVSLFRQPRKLGSLISLNVIVSLIGNGTILAIAAFVLIGLAIG
jgi:hypothetical protein